MPAATFDLNNESIIEQGAYWSITLRYPGDMTGAFLKGQIRKALGGQLLAQFQFTEFAFDQDTNQSSCEMYLRSGTTQTMEIPKTPSLYWVYDVKLYPPGRDPIRLIQGKVFISPGVSD